jgi:hypothetical protein
MHPTNSSECLVTPSSEFIPSGVEMSVNDVSSFDNNTNTTESIKLLIEFEFAEKDSNVSISSVLDYGMSKLKRYAKDSFDISLSEYSHLPIEMRLHVTEDIEDEGNVTKTNETAPKNPTPKQKKTIEAIIHDFIKRLDKSGSPMQHALATIMMTVLENISLMEMENISTFFWDFDWGTSFIENFKGVIENLKDKVMKMTTEEANSLGFTI